MYQNLRPELALHYNFDTRDDCSKRVHRAGADFCLLKSLRVQLHPLLLFILGNYDSVS